MSSGEHVSPCEHPEDAEGSDFALVRKLLMPRDAQGSPGMPSSSDLADVAPAQPSPHPITPGMAGQCGCVGQGSGALWLCGAVGVWGSGCVVQGSGCVWGRAVGQCVCPGQGSRSRFGGSGTGRYCCQLIRAQPQPVLPEPSAPSPAPVIGRFVCQEPSRDGVQG